MEFSLRRLQLPLTQGVHERVVSGLFTTDDAQNAADAAYVALKDSFGPSKSSHSPTGSPIVSVLTNIASQYERDFAFYSRNAGKQLRKEVESIRDALSTLGQAIGDANEVHTISILAKAIIKAEGGSHTNPEARARAMHIVGLLECLGKLVEVPAAASAGRPPLEFVAYATGPLSRLYQTWTGAGFTQDFKLHTQSQKGVRSIPAGDRGFEARGAHFVWTALSAMDPELTIEQARSGMRLHFERPRKPKTLASGV